MKLPGSRKISPIEPLITAFVAPPPEVVVDDEVVDDPELVLTVVVAVVVDPCEEDGKKPNFTVPRLVTTLIQTELVGFRLLHCNVSEHLVVTLRMIPGLITTPILSIERI